jgi:outer membrane protein assembly factor BamB
LWRADLLSPDVAPSPIFAGGMVYVVNASAKLAAIRPDGHGDVTATHVAWSAEDGLPDIVSPLSDGKFVLLTTSGGRLTCYRCADGKIAWEKQLDDLAFRPSPVLVGDRVYMLSKDGTMLIARWGEKFEEIRRCNLFESCKASPAFAPGRIFIRTEKNLYAIGAK